MRLYRIVVAVLLCTVVFLLYDILDEKMKINYPSGVTIVQIRSRFRDVLNGTNFTSAGGGFFIDNKYIATNAHVVENFDELGRKRGDITVFDGKHIHRAKILGVDRDRDIALLEAVSWCEIKIQKPCSNFIREKDINKDVIVYPYPPSRPLIYSWLEMITSPSRSYLDPGNKFLAKVLRGHILGFENWVGVSIIKHSSGIVPGYSGTPLLDGDNCYIGMNSRYNQLHPPESFAISNNNLQDTFREIKDHGYVKMAFLGLLVKQEGGGGVYILAVARGGPAEIFEKYKIPSVALIGSSHLKFISRFNIYSINNIGVKDIEDVWRVLRETKIDDSVQIVLKDLDGKTYKEEVRSVSRFHYLEKHSLLNFIFGPYSPILTII